MCPLATVRRELVAEDPGSDPAFPAMPSLAAAAIELAASLRAADSTFAFGSPFLTVGDPALLVP